MTGEEFFELWCDKGLRRYIHGQARKRSIRKDVQEDYVQEAWLMISVAPANYDTSYYKTIARKAVYSAYWQTYKEETMNQSHMVVYSRNPFDENEILINHKTPRRSQQ
jgi:hypothetical protein